MAGLKSLSEIFNNTLFRIPDYQRGYAWTPSQLKDFWDDLYNLNENKNHYTGVLTVKTVPLNVIYSDKWNEEAWLKKDRGYNAYYVVDGQQRITTSVVFIQALYELVKNSEDNKEKNDHDIYVGSYSLKNIKETYILVTMPPHHIIKTYKFGYESDNPSFKFLRHRVFNEPDGGTVDETFYTLNLENAKRFFKEKLEGVLQRENFDGINILLKKLIVNFKFNFYEIEEDFDVFVAFETMNNRGKKLSNLELLKNRLIYLTTLYDANELKEDERISLRIKIDEAWKEVYHQLGRNKNYPLNDDEFLVAHWIMYFQYSRQKGDDYIEFLLNEKFTPKNIFEKEEIPVTSLEKFQIVSEMVLDEEEEDSELENENGVLLQSKLKPNEIEDYINSLKSAAVHWYNTHNPIRNNNLKPKEQVWIDKLNRIGIGYFRPLVTASFLNQRLTSQQRVELFKAIERFIFIAFRLSRAFSSYRNSEFYKAARKLRKGEQTVNEIIDALEKQISFSFNKEARNKGTFDYVHFKKYTDRLFRNGGGFYKWNGLKYFLYEYEKQKVEERGSEKIEWELFVKNDHDKVSIEHILPQTPDKKCWKELLKGYKEVERNTLQGTLGNLLPLSQSINSSLQNDCFEEKKKAKCDANGNTIRLGYNDGSHSEIEVSQYKEWTPKQIHERGLKLLSFMEERWKIKFENHDAKTDLLGLTFLKK